MNTLYILRETYTNGYKAESLDFIALAAIFCAILVIISKNPIVSVLFLIGLFLSISSYLIILGLNFIGLSYLLVYVGAVSILFLFILMLINVRVSELLSDTSKSIPLAIITSIAFYFSVSPAFPYSIGSSEDYSVNSDQINHLSYHNNILSYLNTLYLDKIELYFVTSKIWDTTLVGTSDITSIGNLMYTSYSIWLILTSLILLLAMVGAIVITIKQKDNLDIEEVELSLYNSDIDVELSLEEVKN